MSEVLASMTIYSPTDEDKKKLQEQLAKQFGDGLVTYAPPAAPGTNILLDRTILLNVKFITSLSFEDMDVETKSHRVVIEYVKYV